MPVIVWNFVFFVGYTIFQIEKGISVTPLWDSWAIFVKNLWFLKSLFVCYILAYLCFHRCSYIWILFTTLFSQFIVWHNICIMYPAFLVGIFLRKNIYLIENKKLLLMFFCTFILMLIFWDESFWPIPDMFSMFGSRSIEPLFQYFNKGLYRVLIGIVGSLFFIILFNVFFNHYECRVSQVLSEWGKYTLSVYIIQFFVLECFLGSYVTFDSTNFYLFHFFYVPVISYFLLGIIVILVKQTYKIKFVAKLFWGKF